MSLYRSGGKRLLDLTLGSAALVLLSPLLLLLMLIALLSMGLPILFRQTRPGLGGAPFTLRKFRTMSDERNPDGELLPDEERLSRFGRWLRRTSLDELPELLNVVRGEMSLVGPRPLLMSYLPRYSREQMRRHDVRPGITGWAQIHGRNAQSWEDRFAYDLWYVDNLSLRVDLEILWRTVLSTLRSEGINAPGHATMPEFRGASEDG